MRQERDNVIYTTAGGRFCRSANQLRTSADAKNFVIICPFGDWSGFRTLAECEEQFPSLEQKLAEHARLRTANLEIPRDLRNHFFEVVER